MRELITMFLTIFVAELGDKTQLATMLFAAEKKTAALTVFAASAGALVLGAGLSVILGAVAGKMLDQWPLKLIAGIGFVMIGGWAIVDYYRNGG
jgi:putative Ca2+/H+ antiporter (TMEM165/GDT1 family)